MKNRRARSHRTRKKARKTIIRINIGLDNEQVRNPWQGLQATVERGSIKMALKASEPITKKV